MSYQEYFKDKHVTLMGLGLLGRGVGDAKFLAPLVKELIVTDLKSEEQLRDSLEQLRGLPNVVFHLGGHRIEDFQNRDLIVKAAGVPLNSAFIAEAKKNNIPVRMSADLFAQFAGIPLVGVTGTRGKSTVSHLVAHILKTQGRTVLLGGNVRGVSTLALLPEAADAVAVLELDSWQLQGFGEAHLSPQVAVFTTFYPDHLNYYPDMQAYFADKANIFLNQTDSDVLVVGEQVAPFLKDYGYQNKIRSRVVVAGAGDLPKKWKLKIPGEHNRYNAALAAAAARALGLDDEEIQQGVESFEGVEGRLQLIKEVRGVKIYNDNNSTTPEATLAALRALGEQKNIILIMGGSDKGLDMRELLLEIAQRCKQVLLLEGSGTDRIKADLAGSMTYPSVQEALEAAMSAAQPSDTILFSPAFASFGMFKNEYDRNDQFVRAAAVLE